MLDRPVGDELDGLLRAAMEDLAEQAPVVPEPEMLAAPVVVLEPADGVTMVKKRSWAVLAAVAAALLVIAAVGVIPDGGDEPDRGIVAGQPVPTVDQPSPTVDTPTAPPEQLFGATQLFPVYLMDEVDGRLGLVLRELPKPLTIAGLVGQLAGDTTPEEQDLSLVTVIPAETEFASSPSSLDQLAQLDFVGGTSIDTLEGPQLTLALAQLVWTLTESPSIDQVIIRINGEDQVWPTSTEDTLPGQPLTRDDYAELGPDSNEPLSQPERDAVAPGTTRDLTFLLVGSEWAIVGFDGLENDQGVLVLAGEVTFGPTSIVREASGDLFVLLDGAWHRLAAPGYDTAQLAISDGTVELRRGPDGEIAVGSRSESSEEPGEGDEGLPVSYRTEVSAANGLTARIVGPEVVRGEGFTILEVLEPARLQILDVAGSLIVEAVVGSTDAPVVDVNDFDGRRVLISRGPDEPALGTYEYLLIDLTCPTCTQSFENRPGSGTLIGPDVVDLPAAIQLPAIEVT